MASVAHSGGTPRRAKFQPSCSVSCLCARGWAEAKSESSKVTFRAERMGAYSRHVPQRFSDLRQALAIVFVRGDKQAKARARGSRTSATSRSAELLIARTPSCACASESIKHLPYLAAHRHKSLRLRLPPVWLGDDSRRVAVGNR